MNTLFLNNSPIKNIVFDFGGVLLDIDFALTYEAMSVLLGADFYPETISDPMKLILTDFEKGLITKETFIWNVQRCSVHETPQGYDVIKAWNKMLLGWQPEKFEFLINLRKKYRLFLLSNTNVLHLEWVMSDLRRNHSIIEFEETYFEKVYYSHLINMRKPDSEIFQFVLNDSHLRASETLFVDDLLANILSAVDLDFQAYHHNPQDNLISSIQKILND